MRRYVFALAVMGLALIPATTHDVPRLHDGDAELASVVLDLAPGAGGGATAASNPTSSLPAGPWSIGVPWAWFDARALALIGALAGLGALVLVHRRERDRRPVAVELPDRIEDIVQPASEARSAPARPGRAELNALSNALATIDMLDVEARTSLRHAARAVADLADLVAQSRLVAAEPVLIAQEVRVAAGRQSDALAAWRARSIRAETRRDELIQANDRLVVASQAVLEASEGMDLAFQAFLAAADNRTPEPPDGMAPAKTRAERLHEALERLTTAIVAVEEKLVDLDEGVVNADALSRALADEARPDDDAAGRATERLTATLDALAQALTPVDRYVIDVRARATTTTRALDEALDRIGTILSGFAGREERRRFHRNHVDIGAKVLMDDRWVACRVVNISLGGAALDTMLDGKAGQGAQLALHGWDGLLPVIVTGNSQGRTHLCFQLTEVLEAALKAFLDGLPVAA